jgi:hypothetical protein
MMGTHRGEASPDGDQAFTKSLLFFLLGTILFTLAYAQDPLYTSNQNQYFLQGLARTGFGCLKGDWLANTLDPTPIFSVLVAVTHQICPWEGVYYLYFGLLAAIYLYSLLGIMAELYGVVRSPVGRWMALALLVSLHSAALRFGLTQWLGGVWDYLFDGGVAGQRVLGAVLQPSTFGVFLLLSIYFFLRRRAVWAVITLVLAPVVHPTYLLSAAVLTLVYMGLSFLESRELRRPFLIGFGALVGVLPILVYTYQVFGPTTPEATAQARDLLVSFRIPHHAVVAEWFDITSLVKLAIVLWALILVRKTPLFHIILWPSVAAVLLTLIQVFTGSVSLALLFPWRLSVFLVPLSVAVVTAYWLDKWLAKALSARAKHPGPGLRWVVGVAAGLSLVLACAGFAKSYLNWQEKVTALDRGMMDYVQSTVEPGQTYLIPTKLQDFRLVTGAPAYIDFKSIPYKDTEVLEWYRRVRLADRFYRFSKGEEDCDLLSRMMDDGQVTHLVLASDHPAGACPGLGEQYRDEDYAVYMIESE